MKRRAKDSGKARTLRQLSRIALRQWESDLCWRAIVEMQMRGSPQTLTLACALSTSRSWRRRALALHIASQLRKRQRGRASTSIEFALEPTHALLLAGLRDAHDEVVRAAVSGLGHRPHPAALAELVRLSTHRHALLRWQVAVSLGRYSEPSAISALLRLAGDPDSQVRDWATFGLGTLHEADTPEVRDLLWRNLKDADGDVRGEALAGLAQRRDPRAVQYLLENLDSDCRVYELDAAEQLASPLLLSVLQKIADGLRPAEADGYWFARLQAAMAACAAAAPPDSQAFFSPPFVDRADPPALAK